MSSAAAQDDALAGFLGAHREALLEQAHEGGGVVGAEASADPKRAGLGVAPWDVLTQGMVQLTGLAFGLLTNLIENALRYGGDAVEVAASLGGEETAPYLVLSVLDRGQGIDPAELASIFNPFIRGDRARGGRGTGLGLAITQAILRAHRGEVSAASEGGLTVFTLRFPF